MKVLILTPDSFPAICGNAVTVERWRRSMTKKGITVLVLSSSQLSPENLISTIDTFAPHIIHAHHILKTGRLLLHPGVYSRAQALPLVLSPSGTDVNVDLNNENLAPAILDVCSFAGTILTQSDDITMRLVQRDRDLASKIAYVQKAFMWFGDTRFDMRKELGFSRNDIIFFLPAGIRPVKNNLECLQAFRILHEQMDEAKIVFAGPPIDRNYAGLFGAALDKARPWARWLPSIPIEAIRSAYAGADVIVNSSLSEGLSNVLLEAMAAGRPLLASNIPGNSWLTGNGSTDPAGLLFNLSEPMDFAAKGLELAKNADLRQQFGKAGSERSSAWPSPEGEAASIISLYEKLSRTTETHRIEGPGHTS